MRSHIDHDGVDGRRGFQLLCALFGDCEDEIAPALAAVSAAAHDLVNAVGIVGSRAVACVGAGYESTTFGSDDRRNPVIVRRAAKAGAKDSLRLKHDQSLN